MCNKQLELLSACEIGRLVNSKEITPTEVLQYFEKRIQERNSDTNAFVYTKFDEAYEQAKILEQKLAAGEYCGPFAGVPFGLKDFLPSKAGWTHSYGGVQCLVTEDEYTARFCEAMEAAGGIAIGKTNAPAYGFRGTTDNKMYGPTSTPFNLLYNAGGSSGGSAAAVADGLVPISEGGDAGGSIRIPASCCNLYGYKASVGTIPSVCYPDAWSATHPFCFAGGLVKTVEDAATLLEYMAGRDARDPYSLDKTINFIREFNQPINKPIRIAYTSNFDLFDVESEVENIVRNAAMRFTELGIPVDEVRFNFNHTANELADQWCKGITIDCALDLNHRKAQGQDLLATSADDFPEEFIYWKDVCDKLTIEDMYKFNLARTDVLYEFERVFQNYDFIISPTMGCLPVLNSTDYNTKGPEFINGKPVESLIGWTQTFLANFVGNPAASIPAGIGSNNLPVGMQVIGKRFNDIDLLKLSYMFETIQPWKQNYSIALDRGNKDEQ